MLLVHDGEHIDLAEDSFCVRVMVEGELRTGEARYRRNHTR
jgi:hypothetical protein